MPEGCNAWAAQPSMNQVDFLVCKFPFGAPARFVS